MFRLVFEPKNPKSSGDYIPVLDKVYEDFNIFRIDPIEREVVVEISPNVNNGHYNLKEVKDAIQWSWDINKLEYHYEGMIQVHIRIPDDHVVAVILK